MSGAAFNRAPESWRPRLGLAHSIDMGQVVLMAATLDDVVDFASTLGATSISDFNTFLQTPAFANAWGQVSSQLSAEGVSDVTLAKLSFLNAYTDLGTRAVGLSTDDIAGAARDFVLQGQTIAGAVKNISGLVDAASVGANPIQITQAFTGTLIGLAAAIAPETAGIGAAIVGAVAGLAAILTAAGLISAPTQGFLTVDTGTITPGSPNWRSFPDPSNPNDAPWFQKCGAGSCPEFSWVATPNGPPLHFSMALPSGVNPASLDMRPIDYVFGNYTTIEDVLAHPDGPANFTQAWAGAWKANAAYVLNGLKPQADLDTFVHFVRLWNRAHDGPVVPISHWSTQDFAPFIQQVVSANARDIMSGNSDVAVNAGALKTPTAPGAATAAAGAGATAPSSGAGTAVVATAVVAAAGASAWVLLGQPLSLAALKGAVGELGARLARLAG